MKFPCLQRVRAGGRAEGAACRERVSRCGCCSEAGRAPDALPRPRDVRLLVRCPFALLGPRRVPWREQRGLKRHRWLARRSAQKETHLRPVLAVACGIGTQEHDEIVPYRVRPDAANAAARALPKDRAGGSPRPFPNGSNHVVRQQEVLVDRPGGCSLLPASRLPLSGGRFGSAARATARRLLSRQVQSCCNQGDQEGRAGRELTHRFRWVASSFRCCSALVLPWRRRTIVVR